MIYTLYSSPPSSHQTGPSQAFSSSKEQRHPRSQPNIHFIVRDIFSFSFDFSFYQPPHIFQLLSVSLSSSSASSFFPFPLSFPLSLRFFFLSPLFFFFAFFLASSFLFHFSFPSFSSLFFIFITPAFISLSSSSLRSIYHFLHIFSDERFQLRFSGQRRLSISDAVRRKR